jgi:hypothetical protein
VTPTAARRPGRHGRAYGSSRPDEAVVPARPVPVRHNHHKPSPHRSVPRRQLSVLFAVAGAMIGHAFVGMLTAQPTALLVRNGAGNRKRMCALSGLGTRLAANTGGGLRRGGLLGARAGRGERGAAASRLGAPRGPAR